MLALLHHKTVLVTFLLASTVRLKNAIISASTTSTNGKHGSFKSAFSGSSQPCKNGFRVSFRNPSDGQSHTLFAPDEHSKKQWISALKKVSPQEDIATNDDSKTNVPTETGMLLFKDVYLKTEL